MPLEQAVKRQECVHELFRRTALEHRSEVAIKRGARRATYGELEQTSNQLANRLIAEGAAKGTFIGIFAEDTIAVVTAMLGILKAGCVFVPFDPSFPEKRLQAMAAQVNPVRYISEGKFVDNLERISEGAAANAIVLGAEELKDEDSRRPEVDSDPDDPCSIYFTSGTTGRAKAIVGRLKGIDHFARWEAEALKIGPGMRVSQLASPSFDGFLKDVFVPLCAGGVVCAPERRKLVLDAERLIDWIDVEGVEVLHCVPSVLRSLLNQGLRAKYFGGLRYVVLAGEALMPADVQRWMEVFGERVQLVNLYGPTETTVTKLCYMVEKGDGERRSIPIGKPIRGSAVMTVDHKGQPCGVGAVGEIYIRTPYRALGYYGEPELTREVFIPNPFSADASDIVYRTGDYGRLLEDGNYEFLGRRDQQVKVRGVRVEMGEVENVVRRHGGVKDVAVVDREDGSGNKYLCAYVVLCEGGKLGEVREHAGEELPEAMVPSGWVEMEELPRTLNGKVDRKRLPTLEQERGKRGEAGGKEKAGTPVEEIVAGIWEEVLRLSGVGVEENFFELGGHSLLATQVISRVKEAVGVELPLRGLFEAPTVRGLGRLIEQAIGAGGQAQESRAIRAVERKGELPLSYAQQRLWVLEQLSGGGSWAYHIPVGMRMEGKLNVTLVEQTLAEIVRRHEVLRTKFPAREGRPVQVIEAGGEMKVGMVDVGRLSEQEREAEAERIAAEEAQRGFDLEQGPVVRSRLVRMGGEDHALLCTLHHIVSDGWSRGVLIREMSQVYGWMSAGEPVGLAELAIQYADYAWWQREWLSGEEMGKRLEYWKKQLEGAPEVLRLATDRVRPAVQSYRGEWEQVRVKREVWEGLRRLARKHGVTLYMVLLAGFEVLLQRYTGERELVVGTSVAGRNGKQVEGLIGFFVNMVALRVEVGGNPRVKELLGRVREVVLEGFAHQEVPFEAVVELQRERKLSYAPLFQVLFSVQNAPTGELEWGGLKLRMMRVKQTGAKYDLALDMWEEGEGLGGELEYNSDLWEGETIREMVEHYGNLLAGMAEGEERRIGELALMSEAEQREVVEEWNRQEWRYEAKRRVEERIAERAKQQAGEVAVVCGDEELSYGELNRRANQLGRYLKRAGVGRGKLVGVCVEHSLMEVVSLLGVLKTGAGYVPLDPGHPRARREKMLGDAGVEVVLAEGVWEQELREMGFRTVCVEREWSEIAGESGEELESGGGLEETAYVIYTSGSTGEPKGVVITHGALSNYIGWAEEVYVRGEKLEFALYSSPAFDLTVTSLYTPLVSGGRVVVYAGRVGEAPIEKIVKRREAGVVKLTPSHLRLIKGEDNGGSGVKRLIVGGEALGTELAREVWESFGGKVEIYNEYGPTEATVGCMIERFEAASVRGYVPVGRAGARARIYLLDEWLNPVAKNVAGEMYIGGAGLAQGYWGKAELTAERFVPDPWAAGERMYRTGDLARYLNDGRIEFIGRRDQQVKFHGFRIELGEIEAALNRHPGVRDSLVLLREDTAGDPRLVAYVLPREKEPQEHDLRRYLHEHLPAHMTPSAFVMLEEFPVTLNGKVNRRSLPPPDGHRPNLEHIYVAPKTEIEQMLANIWHDVLRIEQIGINDNFFELGGHSILAIQIVHRINQAFEINLPMREIFSESTIAGLALLVEETLLEKLEANPSEVEEQG